MNKSMVFFNLDELILLLPLLIVFGFPYSPITMTFCSRSIEPGSTFVFSFPRLLFPKESMYMLQEHCYLQG